MLPRLWFVVGMTVGVMAPLIWAAFVSVPVSRAVSERAAHSGQRDVARAALRETPRLQSTSRSAPTTSSLESAAATITNGTQPKPDHNSVTAAASPALNPEAEQTMKPVAGAALRETPRPQSTSRSAPTTSSLETAAPTITNSPQPKSVLNSVTAPASPALKPEPELMTKPIASHAQGTSEAPDNEKSRARSKDASPRKLVALAPLREGPNVINIYLAGGPHIIVICSELTKAQKLRTGCVASSR
jgi:hypothetical protein